SLRPVHPRQQRLVPHQRPHRIRLRPCHRRPRRRPHTRSHPPRQIYPHRLLPPRQAPALRRSCRGHRPHRHGHAPVLATLHAGHHGRARHRHRLLPRPCRLLHHTPAHAPAHPTHLHPPNHRRHRQNRRHSPVLSLRLDGRHHGLRHPDGHHRLRRCLPQAQGHNPLPAHPHARSHHP